MKRSLNIGLVLISVLLAFSLGTVFAEVSKDKANATSPMNITNTTKNNTTSLNVTNETMPLNSTNVTNPFAHVKGDSDPWGRP